MFGSAPPHRADVNCHRLSVSTVNSPKRGVRDEREDHRLPGDLGGLHVGQRTDALTEEPLPVGPAHDDAAGSGDVHGPSGRRRDRDERVDRVRRVRGREAGERDRLELHRVAEQRCVAVRRVDLVERLLGEDLLGLVVDRTEDVADERQPVGTSVRLDQPAHPGAVRVERAVVDRAAVVTAPHRRCRCPRGAPGSRRPSRSRCRTCRRTPGGARARSRPGPVRAPGRTR